MTQREDFEAWYVKAYHPIGLQPVENGCYVQLGAGMAWDAWQAAQKEAHRSTDAGETIEPTHYYGLEPWEHTEPAVVATMVFPLHSPDKPFIALGDCANLYPDAAQTKPLYTQPNTAVLTKALEMLDFVNDNGYRLDPDEQERLDATIAAIRGLGVE
jgi:hypothetical protein